MAARLEKVMFEGNYDSFPRVEIQQLLTNHGILDAIKVRSNEYADRARKNLDVLGDSEYRSCLEDVLDFVTHRNS